MLLSFALTQRKPAFGKFNERLYLQGLNVVGNINQWYFWIIVLATFE